MADAALLIFTSPLTVEASGFIRQARTISSLGHAPCHKISTQTVTQVRQNRPACHCHSVRYLQGGPPKPKRPRAPKTAGDTGVRPYLESTIVPLVMAGMQVRESSQLIHPSHFLDLKTLQLWPVRLPRQVAGGDELCKLR